MSVSFFYSSVVLEARHIPSSSCVQCKMKSTPLFSSSPDNSATAEFEIEVIP